MSIDPSPIAVIPQPVRALAVSAARGVPGVSTIHPPPYSTWMTLVGSKPEQHEYLRLKVRGEFINTELDIGIEDQVNAVEVATAVQTRIFDILSEHVPSPGALRVTVTVL
ncbi:hypothetical protein [Paeniglutamicibacter sp. Y32M11]|uniref:hypothetical protein n=1 Tax=Paeniglutamicibacter sp. Y32M11 TaxID=2853258 RepID=UPI00104E87A9|nr:hypothetical protein [Paeniglutamicibacter sp. Y32M11]QXQ09764.1 hypothetical protein KUF55_15115 [Paeniglutamicibacter sp. Y32M11]